MDAYSSDSLQRTVSGALAILLVAGAAATLAVGPTAGSASYHALAQARTVCASLPAVTVTARRIDPGAGLLVANHRRHPAGIT